ncbi:hypothetical protein [Aeromonas sp. Y311-2]|jgi:hypothetical protein|uniref:hypothetical protein n=1 Tax=Aeromonas sp. Y311-2 TaxID=2990507 RepID=UPI0022E1DEBB|nr:hypothetical protein [Aeromonas sp. Y311-2]
MDFSKAIATNIELPPMQAEARNTILDINMGTKLTAAEKDDFYSKCGHFPADIFLINDHCFTIICYTPDDWELIPLTKQASERYRCQHLINTSDLHHRSLTIH